jgi:hypothetical protein
VLVRGPRSARGLTRARSRVLTCVQAVPSGPLKAREAKKVARAAAEAKKAKKPSAAKAEPEALDPQLAEFMALMQPRRAQKLWVRTPHTLTHTRPARTHNTHAHMC